MNPLWTQQEAAAYLRISPRTLRTHTARGDIAAVHIGRRTLYKPEDIEAYVERQRTGPAPIAPPAESEEPRVRLWSRPARGRRVEEPAQELPIEVHLPTNRPRGRRRS